MNCSLWLGGKRVNTAAEIKDNFDLVSLRGYFLGGSLTKWLSCNGGADFVNKLNEISALNCTNDINRRLECIFGISGAAPPAESADHTDNGYVIFRRHASLPCPVSMDRQRNSFVMGNRRSSYTLTSRGDFFGSGIKLYGFGSHGSFTNSGSFIGSGSFYSHDKPYSLYSLNRYGYGINLIHDAVFKR